MTAKVVNTGRKNSFLRDVNRYKFLFLLMLPGILYYLIFCYGPMFGIVIAFKEYRITKGFIGSDWVGLKHFIKFFTNKKAVTYISNTFLLNVYGLLWGFPLPIIFAIMLSEVKSSKFRKTVQTVSFLPHFISIVITVSLIKMLFHVKEGVVNQVIEAMGGQRIDFLMSARWYRTIYIGSGMWSGFGWGSIIYLAAILGIDPQLYESAMIDGANTPQRLWHITLPGIRPTIVVMLILDIGSLMSSGFDKAYLLQQSTNLKVSEVIATYVYKRGILAAGGAYPEYSYTTAIGLSQSIINVILLTIANTVSAKLTESSLF